MTDPDRNPGSDPDGGSGVESGPAEETDSDSDPAGESGDDAASGPGDRPESTPDAGPDELARRLHERLAATAEMPVERSASRLLGEAEAVAEDLEECPPDVRTERAAVVQRLLAEVAETGNPEAEEHLDAARRLAVRLSD